MQGVVLSLAEEESGSQGVAFVMVFHTRKHVSRRFMKGIVWSTMKPSIFEGSSMFYSTSAHEAVFVSEALSCPTFIIEQSHLR